MLLSTVREEMLHYYAALLEKYCKLSAIILLDKSKLSDLPPLRGVNKIEMGYWLNNRVLLVTPLGGKASPFSAKCSDLSKILCISQTPSMKLKICTFGGGAGPKEPDCLINNPSGCSV